MFNFFNTPETEEPYITAKTNIPQAFATESIRVGITNAGNTTLTIMDGDCVITTLTMDQQACERLIRMVRSTYADA